MTGHRNFFCIVLYYIAHVTCIHNESTESDSFGTGSSILACDAIKRAYRAQSQKTSELGGVIGI